MNEDYLAWDTNKLRRKADQSWELAGCARQDRDHIDEAKHTANARKYEAEIKARKRS